MPQQDQFSVGRETPWRFGNKHKGTAVKFLPIDYCIWVCENFRKGPWRKACQREIAIRAPEVAEEMGIKVDEKLEGGGFVQGRHDCSHLYRPEAGEHLEPWDGESAPFEADPEPLLDEYLEAMRNDPE